MTLIIRSNGSRWFGEQHAPVEELLRVLESTPLHPVFEYYGNFIGPRHRDRRLTHYWGNFWGGSHVFWIDTDEPAVIVALTRAIRRNQATPAYQQARAEWRHRRAIALVEERRRARERRRGRVA